MLIFLIKLGADPKIPSILENDELETILEVSVRWSHVQIAAYLLKNLFTDDVKQAQKIVDANATQKAAAPNDSELNPKP